jgi:glycosyltransferase involved in cell wall biosynthesis
MRIALVTPSSDPQATHLDPGSAAEATRVVSLAQALASAGHRVTIYARKDSPGMPESAIIAPGATVEHVPAGPAEPLEPDMLITHLPAFASYLAQRWRRNAPGLIHAHSWTMGLAALAGARDLGVPVAQTFGSLAVAEQRHRLPKQPSDARIRLESCIARSADVILASSAAELAELARLGVSRNRVRVVPCGVDTAQFSPEGPVAERNGRPRLVAAEPLTMPDSLPLTVRALADIPDAELVIVGGPAKTALSKDKARRDLLQFAGKLGVAGRLVFTGRIAGDDLAALLRSADVLVGTSAYAPVGMTTLQAMACGTPVVAPSSGAARDALIDKTTGLFSPPGQPGHLAVQVRRLLADPMRLDAYGIAAADRAKSRYSWDRIARETLAAYASCERHQRPAAPAEGPRQAQRAGQAKQAAQPERAPQAGRDGRAQRPERVAVSLSHS